MPRIWIDYCEFLISQRLITKTRHTFDKALMSLPVTQHELIWPIYIKWVESLPNPYTAISIYKRYLRLNEDAREDFIDYLISVKIFDEAILNIIVVLNDDLFHSKKGRSKFELWISLCEIISNFPEKVKNLDCENIIRYGLNKYTDEVGRLWVSLANYFIRQGLFEKARDIFEEALSKISTARDFGLIFNSYLKFEEQLIKSEINEDEDDDYEENNKTQHTSVDNEMDKLINDTISNLNLNKEVKAEEKDTKETKSTKKSHKKKKEDNIMETEEVDTSNKNQNLDLNIKLFRLENLLERRPFLLNDAHLRQNPNNVKEWLNRVELCKNDKELIVETFENAIKTVDDLKAYGKSELLYINYAQYFEKIDDLGNANLVFHRGTQVHFRSIDQIANIWCEWSEMHLRCRNYKDAYLIIKTACTTAAKTFYENDQLKKIPSASTCIKTWCLYADLEEQLGVFQNVKAIYQRMIDLKIATPQVILNYCDYLEKNHYFEETFRVYEQAISLFSWPHIYDIWVIYLSKFVERYKGEKIERARDLFEQAISSCTKDKIKIFYYMYAELEEEYGLLNHAIRILDKGTNDVLKEEKPEVYSVLISKAASFFGITKTRNIFTRALEVLDPDQILDIGLKFAAIERKLGEIDRSRAILVHLSQFCDPSNLQFNDTFWKVWDEFELYHGNEDTYKEMLRTKRSVSARYSLNAPLFVVENKFSGV